MRDRRSFPDKSNFQESFRLKYINFVQVSCLFALRINRKRQKKVKYMKFMEDVFKLHIQFKDTA